MSDIWLADLKALNTKYLWTVYFHPHEFFMTWTDVKLILEGQSGPTQKTCPVTLDYKTTKLKRGDVMVKIRGGLTALFWKDRWEVYMLSNIDPPPAYLKIWKKTVMDYFNAPSFYLTWGKEELLALGWHIWSIQHQIMLHFNCHSCPTFLTFH